MSLLSPSLLARLESLQLNSRHRLAGRFGGEHISSRYGNTVDFADFREYHPGDDFRRIDYHVMARLDQVLIKLYEADDEVTVRLLVDTSASMASQGKLAQAKRVAAAIGFVALTAHDAVSVHTFPGTGPAPRFAGRAAAPALFSYLETLRPAGSTPFSAAAGQLLGRVGPPGITVVISDLLTPEWPALTRLRASGSDLVVFHLLAEEDIAPDLSGDLELLDREDGTRLTVSVTDEVAEAYRTRVKRWREEVGAAGRAVGGTYLPILADEDIETLLFTVWRRTGILR